MEHLGDEFDLGCLVGVLVSKLNRQIEASTVPNGVLWTKNDGLPVEERVT